VYAAAALISHDPQEWSVVWPIFQANESFGVEVLKVVASDWEHNSFATALKEGEIADICIWISKLGLDNTDEKLGRVTPAVALTRWWNTLINFLMHKGTPGACAAIKRLIEALPQYDGLKFSLREAEDRMRQATWAPLAPEEVIRIVANETRPKLVISIYGILTRGAWQKKVNSELQSRGFRHELLDYGFFMKLLMPWARAQKIDWFRVEYEKLVKEPAIIPSVIAHSFGTYIVANAIEKYAEIRFDRVIFCGSIVRKDFEWDSLVRTGRVGAILNECGGKDIWVKLAEWSIPNAGASGSSGFNCSGPGFYQRVRSRFRHSDYFYPLNYTNNWVPFLSGAVPSELAVERTPAVNWKFRLLIACALLTLLIVAYFMIRKTS
jgi:hypothetical protein